MLHIMFIKAHAYFIVENGDILLSVILLMVEYNKIGNEYILKCSQFM